MSGHNPHGRLGQPNPSWNHLQVPSFIPRQPQLAHMSNERPMVRSSLTWHTPTHTEAALYNYMAAATHKTPLDINPLLPAFVRPPAAPFGSVDLSLASVARHNSSPLPRNVTPPLGPSPHQNNPSSDLSTAKVLPSTNSVIQSITSNNTMDKQPIPPTSSPHKTAVNGETQSQSLMSGPGLFIRDATQINNDIVKQHQLHQQHQFQMHQQHQQQTSIEPTVMTSGEPIEFVKEAIYHQLMNSEKQRFSPKHPSSRSHSPNLVSTTLPNSTLNYPTHTDTNIPLPVPTAAAISHIDNNGDGGDGDNIGVAQNNNGCTNSIQQKDCPASASNDDSLDSSGGKTRRRRKPNKTTRMSSSDNDERLSNNSNLQLEDETDSIASNTSKTTATINQINVINAVACNSKTNDETTDKNESIKQPISETIPDTTTHKQQQQSSAATSSTQQDQACMAAENSLPSHSVSQQQPPQVLPSELAPTLSERNNSIIIATNTTNLESAQEKSHTDIINDRKNVDGQVLNSSLPSSIKPIELNQETTSKGQSTNAQPSQVITEQISTNSHMSETLSYRPGKRKTDPTDECETIDKIAAMIADGSDIDDSLPVVQCSNDKDTISPIIINGTENLKGILETKPIAFEDVENKLEEMFAGIEDDRPRAEGNSNVKAAATIGNESQELQNKDNLQLSTTKAVQKKRSASNNTLSKNIKNKNKTQSTHSAANESNSINEETTQSPPPKKKKVLKKKKATNNGKNSNSGNINNKKGKGAKKGSHGVGKNKVAASTGMGKIKEDVVDVSVKYRGPYVQVKSDGSSNVINAPISEEDLESKAKNKKVFVGHSNNDRNKIRGLHVSTLSMKYDADTTDKTWMCVFCKMGPHRYGLGDLFGPYIITTTGEDFELCTQDPTMDVFKSKRTKVNMIQKRSIVGGVAGQLSTNAPSTSGTSGNPKKKRKTNDSLAVTTAIETTSGASFLEPKIECSPSVDLFYGMTKASEQSYEVWMHGDCAVWSNGVYIVGTRVIGLEAAVWSSSRHKCCVCLNYGAMLSCLHRGCIDEAHVPCAQSRNWNLCDDDFKSFCDKHSIDENNVTATTSAATTTSSGVEVATASTSKST